MKRIRKKATIRVLFISCSASLWKQDSLYNAMKQHPRFDAEILLTPNLSLPEPKMQQESLHELRNLFDKKGYHYLVWSDIEETHPRHYNLLKGYDIILYPQPWEGLVPHKVDFVNNLGCLFISCEYAFHSGNQKWAYNKWLQNAAWIDCYENEIICTYSKQQKKNHGINSVATGLPFMDEYQRKHYVSPWKPQMYPCKKIIWAPHWTIRDDGRGYALPSYSNFLKIADYMLEFANAHTGELQFAFKPHPLLLRELYKHPDWGKEKTDAYYDKWKNGVNTQLETGSYVDLFMTSDAMIHDSSSFCCEYLYTGKPVLFMVKNEAKQVSELNEMSHSAFYAQYLGYSVTDLQSFLENQVIRSDDPKKETRELVVQKYLLPPHGKSAAENILTTILDREA